MVGLKFRHQDSGLILYVMLGTGVGIEEPVLHPTIKAKESPYIAVIKQANSSHKPKMISKEIKREAAVLHFYSVLSHEFEVISCHVAYILKPIPVVDDYGDFRFSICDDCPSQLSTHTP